ncbi:GNAT family N-acetyltransferase [Hymenobacter oligotrophus]|uniref:GNAT family N-acetyltransferase n=1 Tax=Hymenobacter oligotrophus TaxID=2319843 RepID=A0A3B7R3L5_9BACT|nr:GNAT family N-acetyltransferase [Hymenobacter oligotrophus]AYA38332.1 GNAT family N-acetyltransferase [Hymenobacter oligotrophus]
MLIREAHPHDIKQMQVVRHAVKENVLSDPGLVTDQDCDEYICRRGKGWVCEVDDRVVGFAIADLQDQNIWALFVDPEFEGRGIGKQLHDCMLAWYFAQNQPRVWLGTEPNTRAERFYRRNGWQAVGQHGKGEVKFEMQRADWLRLGAAYVGKTAPASSS